MIIKAKDLRVGDRIGRCTIIEKEYLLPYIEVVFTNNKGIKRTHTYNDWDEIAIHRETLIKKHDGSLEPFSKEKLKRSIYKAILDLPESEWDFKKVQSWVDHVAECNPKTAGEISYLLIPILPRTVNESYNKQRRNV